MPAPDVSAIKLNDDGGTAMTFETVAGFGTKFVEWKLGGYLILGDNGGAADVSISYPDAVVDDGSPNGLSVSKTLNGVTTGSYFVYTVHPMALRDDYEPDAFSVANLSLLNSIRVGYVH